MGLCSEAVGLVRFGYCGVSSGTGIVELVLGLWSSFWFIVELVLVLGLWS